VPNPPSSLTVQPNPANEQITVSVQMNQEANVLIKLVGLTTILPVEQEIAHSIIGAGENSFTVNTAQLPEGVYAILLTSELGIKTHHFQIKH
jgi:Secretion system C-terminal sorting domain